MKCEIKGIDGGSLPEEGLTVGRLFAFECHSEVPLNLNPQSLSLQLDKADRFRIKILETKRLEGQDAHFVATSYMAGSNKIANAVLTDGKTGVPIEPFTFEVQSVLDPVEEPKPVPPFDPQMIMWPIWVYAVIACAVSLILLTIALVWRKRRARTAFEIWRKTISTPLSPFDQMNKELRAASKERKPLQQVELLETAFRNYLCRSFDFDFRELGAKAVARRLKRVVSKSGSHAMAEKASQTASRNALRFFNEIERVKVALQENRSDRKLDDKEALSKTLPALHELLHDLTGDIERFRDSRKGRA